MIMGIQERKEREKLQRRNNIIEAAEKTFFTKGFENSTMDDVAEAAELSKGTLYLYFESKEELFSEIAKRGQQLLEEYFIKAIQNKENGLKKVRAIGQAFIKFFREHSEYHEAMLYGHSKKEAGELTIDERIDQKEKENKNVFVNSIIEGINDGSIRQDIDPVIVSFLLWGQTMGVLQLIASKGSLIEKMTGIGSEELLEHSLDFNSDALDAKYHLK
jgi:AcrR family transcriptional regulator